MQPLPTDVATAVLEAWRLGEELPLWPGWNPVCTPLVLHGPDRAYLIGHPAPPDGYEPAEPLGGRAVHAGGPLPHMTANTAMPIAGHLCALAHLSHSPLTDTAPYARLLLHERRTFRRSWVLHTTRPTCWWSPRAPACTPACTAA